MFEPTMDAELARQSLEGFKQMGKVAPYVTRFRELVGVIRNMSEEDKYRAFMKGLKPNIWQMVGPNVRGDLEAAILMAEQFDLYGQSESVASGNRPGGSGQGTSGGKSKNKQKGAVHVVVEAPAASSSSGQVAVVDGQRKGKGKKPPQNQKGKGQGQRNQGNVSCFCCGGSHVMRDCPEVKAIQQKFLQRKGN